jgi:hypothetical protein
MKALESYRDRIARICAEWDRAEEGIKLAEQVNNKVVFPSIKELRYAGRRIVEALNKINRDGSQSDIEDLFQDAEFDCHRARHDAIDAATSKIAVDLQITAEKIGYEAILKAFPELSDLRNKLDNIRDKIRLSRGDRESRENIYSELEGREFVEIVNQYRKFQKAEPIMKELAQKHRRDRYISYTVGVGGILFSLVSIAITLAQ